MSNKYVEQLELALLSQPEVVDVSPCRLQRGAVRQLQVSFCYKCFSIAAWTLSFALLPLSFSSEKQSVKWPMLRVRVASRKLAP